MINLSSNFITKWGIGLKLSYCTWNSTQRDASCLHHIWSSVCFCLRYLEHRITASQIIHPFPPRLLFSFPSLPFRSRFVLCVVPSCFARHSLAFPLLWYTQPGVLSLGLSGTDHLTLADFDPTLLTPTWIPPNQWQGLLSLSTLHGPLEGLCTKVAAEPKWQEWYHHESPETLDFPGIEHSPTHDSKHEREEEKEELEEDNGITEFHRLLVLRCLRPDRLTFAMKDYVVDILNNLNAQPYISLLEVLKQVEHSIPVMVLLPHNSSLEISTVSPSTAILQLAEVTLSMRYHLSQLPDDYDCHLKLSCTIFCTEFFSVWVSPQ